MRKVYKPQEVSKLPEPVEIPDVENVFAAPAKNVFATPTEANGYVPDTDNHDSPPLLTAELYAEIASQISIEQNATFTEKLKQCEKNCEEMLARAKKEADELRSEAESEKRAVLEKAELERKDILEKAFIEGRNNAIDELTDVVNDALTELGENLAEIKAAQEEFFEEYERQLTPLAADIAAKLIAQRIEDDDATLLPLIKSILKTMRDSEYVTVEVSQKHTKLIEILRTELPMLSMEKYTEIVASRELPDDGVIIESAERAVDASIGVQLKNLREFLKG